MNIHIERRLYPRYSVQWPVEVLIPDRREGRSFDARVLNLSKGGVQIECSRELVETLLEQRDTHPHCDLCIVNPTEEGCVEARCRLVVNRRVAQDCYQLGLKFIEVDRHCEPLLVAYLDSLERVSP